MAKILIIDDEPMILTLATKILERDSHSIVTASRSNDAISLFREQHKEIDMVLVDMNLDELSGCDLLTEFRKLTPEIAGIISSGNNMNKNDLPENLHNNIHFLQKPYKAKDLSELVNSILTIV